jgi:hypothetical protein
MSAFGPTRKSCDVRFRAAVRAIADIKRALIRSTPIYQYTPSYASMLNSNQTSRMQGYGRNLS